MSNNWIALIPQDPYFLPTEAAIQSAKDRFAALAPEADEIEIKLSDHIQFFDCGENFTRISCPSCHQTMDNEWWQEKMHEDFEDGGFHLKGYRMPCCGHWTSLNDLQYHWSQGFARFAIDVMNPNIGKLTNTEIHEFELLLGTPLRVIYRHL